MFSIFEPTCLLMIVIAHNPLNTFGGTIHEDSLSEIVKKLQNKIELMEKDNENIKYVLKANIELQKAKLDDFSNDGPSENENVSSLIQRSKQDNFVVIPSELRNYDVNFNCIKNCSPSSRSCDEALTANNFKEGVYLLKEPKSDLKPFYVYCTEEDKSERGWMVIQRRLDGSVDFTREWSDYKLGFGDLDGEYWIGLERLHQITSSKPHELWFVVQMSPKYGNKKRYAKYSKFIVGSEADGYKLTVGGYSSDMGEDVLADSNSMKFSTIDRDNDQRCAFAWAYGDGGWWYNSCGLSNFNARYFNEGDDIVIRQQSDLIEQLRKVFMAIRPK